MSEETRLKSAISMYKQNNKNKGVRWDNTRKRWNLNFKFLDDTIKKRFLNKDEAMETYDKLALFKFKEDAILHFENRREFYMKCDLASFYQNILTPRKRIAKYTGVTATKSKNKIRYGVVVCGVENLTHLHCGKYNNEEEAAIIYDKVSVFLGKEKGVLNFPELVNNAYFEEGRKIFDKFTNPKRTKYLSIEKTSKFNGVSFRNGVWRSEFTKDGIRYRGSFTTEGDAARAYDYHVRSNEADLKWLNFPAETITELPQKKCRGDQYRTRVQIVETGQIFNSIGEMVSKWGSYIKAISDTIKDPTKTLKGVHLREIK